MADQQRSRGRRARGEEDAREGILGAARQEFAERGYGQASVRGVARRAGVDPGLVRYYFPGGKAEVFATTLTRRGVDPSRIAAGIVQAGTEGLGSRLVRTVLGVWDAPGGREAYRLAFAAAASGEEGTMVRDFLTEEIFSKIAASMTGPDVPLRVNLVASHMLGVLTARYVLGLEPLTSTPADEIAEAVGPVLQRYLDPPDDGPRALAQRAPGEHYSSHEE